MPFGQPRFNNTPVTDFAYTGQRDLDMQGNSFSLGLTPLEYFLTDQLGSVVAMTDSNGNQLGQQRYMPFGQVRTSASPITQTDFAYTGQRNLDAQGNSFSLGLMDYNARFYDDSLGRFTQPDTMTQGGPQGLNLYSYTLNNPINFNDPSGHCIGEDGTHLSDANPECRGSTDTDLCNMDPGAPACNSGDDGGTSQSKTSNGKQTDCNAVCQLENQYIQNWENFVPAYSTCEGFDTSNGLGYYANACAYASAWWGAHSMLLTGTVILTWEAIAATGVLCALNPECEQEATTTLTSYYPPNMGFQSEPEEIILKTDDIISRYGSEFGHFFSPADVPAWARSLSPDVASTAERVYQVTRPFTVYAGPAAAWFGQAGGGMQYYSVVNEAYLVEQGFINAITK